VSETQCSNQLNSSPESPVFCLSGHSSSSPSNISSARPSQPPSDPPIESLSVCTGLAHHYESFVPDALPLWNWKETGQVSGCRFHLKLVSCFEMFVRAARCRATATASIAMRSCRRTHTLGWQPCCLMYFASFHAARGARLCCLSCVTMTRLQRVHVQQRLRRKRSPHYIHPA
jgi:hypothetical protein